MVFENPNINLNRKGLEDQLNYKKKLCLSSRYKITTQLPLTHIQCTLSLVTTEFAKSFICQQSLFTSSSIFVTNSIREARFSESLIDYHFSSHGLIKLPLDHFSAENEWLPCWLVKKKTKNIHEAKRTAVPCHEFCSLKSKEPRSKREVKTKRQQQQTAVTTLCSNHEKK